MIALLRKLLGTEATEATEARNRKLDELVEQGRQLDRVVDKLKVAAAISRQRAASSTVERDRLRVSNSGQLRIQLDSKPGK